MYSEKEIKEALASISEIKQTLQGNVRTIRPLFNCSGYVLLCIWMGILMMIWSTAMILAEHLWGSLGASPSWVKMSLVGFGVLVLVFVGIWKLTIIKRYALEKLGGMTIIEIFQLSDFQKFASNSYLVCGVGFVLACIVSYRIGNWWLMLPASYYIIAVMSIQLADMFGLSDYRIIGIVCLVIAIVSGLFMRGHYLYWLGGSLCLTFFSMAFVLFIVASREKSRTR